MYQNVSDKSRIDSVFFFAVRRPYSSIYALTEYPLTPAYLYEKLPQAQQLSIHELLDEFSCQVLIELNLTTMTVTSSTDRLVAIAETRADDPPPSKRPKTVDEEIEYLIVAPSVRELEKKKMGSEISELLGAKNAWCLKNFSLWEVPS